MVIKTIVAVVFFLACTAVMYKMPWMLDLCVPVSQEEKAKATARRWKGIVAAFVVGAWLCAGCIAFGLNMPKALSGVVIAGPIALTFPVIVWVFLVY